MEKRLTIGVLIGNANSPHTMKLMQGIYDAAEKMDVNVIYFLGIHTSYYYRAIFGDDAEDNYDYQFNVVYDYAWLGKADALIISYGSLSIFLEDTNKENFLNRFQGIPYVLVEEKDESGRGTSIISDNYQGMYRITEHLIRDHGYRKFTFLAGPQGNTDAAERMAAFLDACRTYGICIEEDMIAYGDYSACVETQVNALLDRYPDMQAMVCANDVMADTAYQECAKRGILVGKDIAITGYDDWEDAEAMLPPLTTVQQDATHMGYTALQSAIALCEGKEPVSRLEPAVVKIRCSCGCEQTRKSLFPRFENYYDAGISCYANDVSEIFMERIGLSDVDEQIYEGIQEQIRRIIQKNVEFFQSRNNKSGIGSILIKNIMDLFKGKYSTYLSLSAVAETTNAYILDLIKNMRDSESAGVLIELMDTIQRYIQSISIKGGNERFSTFQQDTWFMPLISRDMMNHIDQEKEFYGAAMTKLSALQTKSAYLYLFEKPVNHKYNEAWVCPDRMYLASSYDGQQMYAYDPENRPVITKDCGFAEARGSKHHFNMCAFSLFNGETQYGILFCEIKIQDVALMYLASMQISIALHFHELSVQQKKTQKKLERLVQEVKEKNEILGFISEYDQLTGCLNRRGFMEKAVHFCHQEEGERAIILFADLDHLKEINDTFGHAAGDFAIRSVAQILKEALSEDSLIARIGGDEFIALIPLSAHTTLTGTLEELHQKSMKFNQSSDKPYYVELSAGAKDFVCDPQITLSAMIEEADQYLYHAKEKRRKSVVKE